MAAPYNIDTTVPGDTDLQSAYPLAERTFRTVVNEWLTFMSNPATGIIKSSALPPSVVNSAPLETYYTAGGTHTFATDTTFFQIEAVGGGGGGGGVDGLASGLGAGGGGASGFYGKTAILAIGAVTSGTVVIGTGGAGGVGASHTDGSSGGDTTWADGTNSFTWEGGFAGETVTASTGGSIGDGGAAPAPIPASLYGHGDHGKRGDMGSGPGHTFPFAFAAPGAGGTSPFGQPANPTTFNASGQAGTGYGAGGSGALANDTNSNFNGAAGRPGLLIVREW